MDPLAPLKLIALGWVWWMQRLGPKLFWALMALSVLVALAMGCRETYG